MLVAWPAPRVNDERDPWSVLFQLRGRKDSAICWWQIVQEPTSSLHVRCFFFCVFFLVVDDLGWLYLKYRNFTQFFKVVVA